MVSSHLSLCHLGLQAESLALRVFYLFTGSRRAEAQKKSSARNREAQTFLCKIIGVACPGLSSFFLEIVR
jgi:hypothetical protein